VSRNSIVLRRIPLLWEGFCCCEYRFVVVSKILLLWVKYNLSFPGSPGKEYDLTKIFVYFFHYSDCGFGDFCTGSEDCRCTIFIKEVVILCGITPPTITMCFASDVFSIRRWAEGARFYVPCGSELIPIMLERRFQRVDVAVSSGSLEERPISTSKPISA